MKLLASESYNVAWFKLADFVVRGEKERALSVHRLLMHSVPDEAVRYQLEADILLAFEDEASVDFYHLAANLYKKNGKMRHAAAVYEHVSLFVEDEKVLEALFEIYLVLPDNNSALSIFAKLAKICLERNNFALISNLFHRYLMECDESLQKKLSMRFVTSLLEYDEDHKQINSYLYQTIDLLLHDKNEEHLLNFLSDLEDLNPVVNLKAQNYIGKEF